MPGNKFLGLLLIVIGVVANNYVYLHDLAKGNDVIFIGIYSWIGIIVSLLVIAAGLLIAVRAKQKAKVGPRGRDHVSSAVPERTSGWRVHRAEGKIDRHRRGAPAYDSSGISGSVNGVDRNRSV